MVNASIPAEVSSAASPANPGRIPLRALSQAPMAGIASSAGDNPWYTAEARTTSVTG